MRAPSRLHAKPPCAPGPSRSLAAPTRSGPAPHPLAPKPWVCLRITQIPPTHTRRAGGPRQAQPKGSVSGFRGGRLRRRRVTGFEPTPALLKAPQGLTRPMGCRVGKIVRACGHCVGPWALPFCCACRPCRMRGAPLASAVQLVCRATSRPRPSSYRGADGNGPIM